MKIKITTFNCLAWKWAKKHRTLAAFKPEVADWTEKDWDDWEPYLDDWELPDRYENYIKFFLKEGGFFCLQEVDNELAILISKNKSIHVVNPMYGIGYHSGAEIGNMIIYVRDDHNNDFLHDKYNPLLFSVMWWRTGLADTKQFNLAQINVPLGKTFWLLNVHMPGFNRYESEEASKVGVERIINYLKRIKLDDYLILSTLKNLIIAGDFNVDIKRNWSGPKLLEHLEQFGLSYFPFGEVVTEPSTGSVIDYIWINEEMVKDIDPENPITVPGSDHKAVSISFEV